MSLTLSHGNWKQLYRSVQYLVVLCAQTMKDINYVSITIKLSWNWQSYIRSKLSDVGVYRVSYRLFGASWYCKGDFSYGFNFAILKMDLFLWHSGPGGNVLCGRGHNRVMALVALSTLRWKPQNANYFKPVFRRHVATGTCTWMLLWRIQHTCKTLVQDYWNQVWRNCLHVSHD